MASSDVVERRLVLQVARDVAAQTYLRTLLVTANTRLATRRDELLTIKRRIARARMKRVSKPLSAGHTTN